MGMENMRSPVVVLRFMRLFEAIQTTQGTITKNCTLFQCNMENEEL